MAESRTSELLRSTEHTAVHLELRDSYTPDDPDWLAWQRGERFDPAQRWRDWFDLMRATTSRGVLVRRARIVSEPISPYVQFEYDVTEAHNLAAGEQVRWLSRQAAADLLVPPLDFWIFDTSTAVLNHFDGVGGWVGEEHRDDAELAVRYLAAFDAVWAVAIPHDQYRPARL